jgi:hypothetical protein
MDKKPRQSDVPWWIWSEIFLKNAGKDVVFHQMRMIVVINIRKIGR